MSRPIAWRNVTRYVTDVAKSVPLYEALGFETLHRMGDDMAVLQQEGGGLRLILHVSDEVDAGITATAIAVTMTGDVREARDYVEKAGWRLLRAPDESDEGFFFIYQDLDGNPLNLVGSRHG